MDTSQSFNILIGLCVVAFIIVLVTAGVIYFATTTARNERGRPNRQNIPPSAVFSVTPPSLGQTRLPETLPPPWPEEQSSIPNNDRIRFSEPQVFTPPNSNRLKWGSAQSTNAPPQPSPDGQQRCPVCRKPPPYEGDGIKCRQCGTLYHLDCWEMLNQSCRICEHTVS